MCGWEVVPTAYFTCVLGLASDLHKLEVEVVCNPMTVCIASNVSLTTCTVPGCSGYYNCCVLLGQDVQRCVVPCTCCVVNSSVEKVVGNCCGTPLICCITYRSQNARGLTADTDMTLPKCCMDDATLSQRPPTQQMLLEQRWNSCLDKSFMYKFQCLPNTHFSWGRREDGTCTGMCDGVNTRL